MSGIASGARIPSLGRAMAIMQTLVEAGRPLELSALSTLTRAPKTSVMTLCRELTAERLLVRGSDGRYWIGPRWVEYAAAGRRSMPRVRRIGFSVRRMSNPFHRAQAAAVERFARDLQAEARILDADLDSEAQTAHIEGFIDDGVELILVEPVSPTAAEHAVARAVAESIPVIALGARLVGASMTVASDNVQAGQLAGQHAVRCLGGEGRAVAFGGRRLSSTEDRLNGFAHATSPHPGIETVIDDGVYTDGEEPEEMLRQRIKDSAADIFFAANDQLALRMSDILRQEELDVPIIAVDGSSAAVRQVREQGPIVATVLQDPALIVERAFEVGAALREGTRFATGTVLLPTAIITPSNASGVPAW